MLLTILGIVATIIFGILGILYVLKYRERVRLTYMEEDCIPLFKSIVKNMDGIEILYDSQRVTPSLTLLKGCFINTGNKDIDKSIIHKPISLFLPEESRWLRATLVSTSPGAQAQLNIKNDSLLELTWDLLKKDEFIKFDALIHAEEAIVNRVGTLITFAQRITNLDMIKREQWPLIDNDKWPLTPTRLFRRGTMVMATTYTVAGLVLLALTIYFPPKEIRFLIEEQPGKIVEVSMSPRNDNVVSVKGINNSFSSEMKLDGFIAKYEPQPVIGEAKRSEYLPRGVAAMALLLGATMFIFEIRRGLRERKIIRLMQAR